MLRSIWGPVDTGISLQVLPDGMGGEGEKDFRFGSVRLGTHSGSQDCAMMESLMGFSRTYRVLAGWDVSHTNSTLCQNLLQNCD